MNADERNVRFHIERLEERLAPGTLKVNPPSFNNELGNLSITINKAPYGLTMAEGRTGGVITWTS